MLPYGMTISEYENESRKAGDTYVRGRRHNNAGDMRNFRVAKKRARRGAKAAINEEAAE